MSEKTPHRLGRAVAAVTLGAIALLAGLSIVGAFLGAERAGAMFRSAPMASYWVGLIVLLAGGFCAFARLRRNLWLILAHAACIAVLVGGILGSEAGHKLIADLGGPAKIHEGYLTVARWRASDELHDATGRVVGAAPFQVYLDELWREHHDPADLVIAAPDGEPSIVPWSLGREVDVGGATVRVLRYLRRATPRWAGAPRGHLHVRTDDGRIRTIEAEPGRRLALTAPAATAVVAQRFGNLRWELVDGGQKAVDTPGPPLQPALLLILESPDGGIVQRVIYAGRPLREPNIEGAAFWYDFPAPDSASPGGPADAPAMEIELTEEGRRRRAWLFADPKWERDFVALGPPHGDNALLILTHRFGRVKDVKASIAAIAPEKPTDRAVISDGRPFRHGGYHLYRHDSDEDGTWATFRLRSDTGLSLVYLGFAGVLAGVFGRCWLQPALRAWRTRPTETRPNRV